MGLTSHTRPRSASWFRALCFIGGLGFLVGGLSRAEGATSAKHVLLLHEESIGEPIRAGFDSAFVEAMRTPAAQPIELYEETIETLQPRGSDQPGFQVDYLRRKYAELPVDVIVAQGMVPLTFARRHRDLFGDPPIVTVVAPSGQIGHRADNITGLQGGRWITGVVDFALALLPDTSAVLVVDGARQNGSEFQSEFERQFRDRAHPIALHYLRDLSLDEVLTRVKDAPPHAIVLYVRQTKRTATQDVDQFDALTQVVHASSAPVFSQVEDFLGHGIVGGYMWEYHVDAKRMADIARQLADGSPASEIPTTSATYATRVDWRELQRWRIPVTRVPMGTEILYRPESFYSLYRQYIAAALVVIVGQLALIGGLLTQRVRRRRAEEATRESEERYRSVVDTQSEMICRFRPDSTLTFVNDAYCRFAGKPRHELLGTKFIELIPLSSRDDVFAHMLRAEHDTQSLEHPVLLPNGTVGWHHWINQAIRDEQGRLIELQGVGRDITERRRAEEALEIAQARHRAILRAIPDLMFMIRRDGTYLDYHARDPRLLFVPPEKFLGKRIADVMPPAHAAMFMDALARTFETTEPIVVEYSLALEETRHFEARLVRADDDRALTMVRDVTEAARVKELNRDLAGRLIASQEVERQRIARELHDDLSQKLALLSIDIDQLSNAQRDPAQAERWQQLRARAGEIGSDIHELSYRLHPSKLETLGLRVAMQALCRDVSKQSGVHVAFEHGVLPDHVDPQVSLCVYRITQEALRNVVRHSQAREAQVDLACEAGRVTLHIADSGVGFDPAAAEHAGLGLLSMRERVAFLGGLLAIHSAPGLGTRIGVQIPLGEPVNQGWSTDVRSA